MEENVIDTRIAEVFAKTAAQEAEALALFEQRFEKHFPMPERAVVKLMNSIGWQFISIIIQSVFSIVLAALRTADMFFDAAAGTSIQMQWAEAIAAVGAIELVIVIFATIKSEIENRRTQIEDLKAALNIDLRLLWTGIIACVAISIIAGLGVSFKGFGIEWIGFRWITAVTMGAGASLVAWVSGDILGAMLARWNNAVALANVLYAEEIEKREAKKRELWEAAPERGIARSELMELKQYLAANRTRPSRTPAPQPHTKTPTRSNEIRVKIYNELDANWDANHDITLLPGPTKLMEDLGVAKSYASEVIKAWKADRGILTNESQDPNAAQ